MIAAPAQCRDNGLRSSMGTFGMALGDKSEDGADDVCHALLREGAVLDAVEDAPALTQLHHHVDAVSILKHVLQTRHFESWLPF